MSNLSLSTFPRKHLFKIIIICTSIAIFSFAFWVRTKAQTELNVEKSSLQQQQSMNNTADESALLLERYLNQYRSLQEQGIIGDPKRLQWLESVQANADDNLIPKLNVVLSGTELTTDTHPLYHNPELNTKITRMQVTFTLLHEGDFYHLLNELQVKAQGIFNVEECDIRRNDAQGDELAEQKLEGKFIGDCSFRWYSLADITQAWEVPVQ
jgi:hypothetical protein